MWLINILVVLLLIWLVQDAITDEKAAKQKASGEYQALPNKLGMF